MDGGHVTNGDTEAQNNHLTRAQAIYVLVSDSEPLGTWTLLGFFLQRGCQYMERRGAVRWHPGLGPG